MRTLRRRSWWLALCLLLVGLLLLLSPQLGLWLALGLLLLLVHHARRQDPSRFAWREPPYEYERKKPPIDILCGTDRIRRRIEGGGSPRALAAGWTKERATFLRRRNRYLLY